MRSRRGDTYIFTVSPQFLCENDRKRGNNELQAHYQQVESRVASRRAARAKEKEYRMREWQKQLKEESDRSDQQQHDLLKSKSIVTGVTKYPLSVSEKKGINSISGSRRNSRDSLEFSSGDAKELQQKVNEIEEKLKETMVSNAQLEKEKQCYSYQIETLKDDYQDLEECYYKLQKDYKDKSRKFELLNRDFAKLKDDNSCLKECVKQRDQLLKENGLRFKTNEYDEFICETLVNGNLSEYEKGALNGKLAITKETAAILSEFEGETVDEKLKSILTEKKDLLENIKQLKNDLKEERERNDELENNNHLVNGIDVKQSEAETNRVLHEYKLKLMESEKERNNLQNTITRLETNLDRMKISVEDLEKNENDLKIEKRKIARELREANSRIEELEASNSHLQKRIDKLMSSRLANLNSDS